MAYEYVYLIKPDTYPLIKIGRWSGTVSDLRSRYSTYYARFDMTIFQCKDSIVTENILHRECAEFNECRELYRSEAIERFNRVAATCCETFCHSRDLEDAKTKIALKRAKNIAEENRNLKRKLAKLEEKAENDKRKKEEEKAQKAAQKQAEKEEAERSSRKDISLKKKEDLQMKLASQIVNSLVMTNLDRDKRPAHYLDRPNQRKMSQMQHELLTQFIHATDKELTEEREGIVWEIHLDDTSHAHWSLLEHVFRVYTSNTPHSLLSRLKNLSPTADIWHNLGCTYDRQGNTYKDCPLGKAPHVCDAVHKNKRKDHGNKTTRPIMKGVRLGSHPIIQEDTAPETCADTSSHAA